MKKTQIFVLALAGVVTLSVNARTKKKSTVPAVQPKEQLVKPVPADSFSYAMGLMQSASLKQYLVSSEGVNPSHLSEVAKGMTTDMDTAELAKKIAFTAGMKIRKMNIEQVIPTINQQATGSKEKEYINLNQFTDGLCTAMTGAKATMTQSEAQALVERQQKFISQEMKTKNAEFLATNKKQKGIITLPSGLQYKVITEGTGAMPTDSSEVEVNYEGKLIDGSIFDSSYERKQTASFGVKQVIKGWTEALQLMKEGSTYELYIPYDLAYGEQGNQAIPPYSALIFKVDLIKVKKNPAAIPATPLKAAKKVKK